MPSGCSAHTQLTHHPCSSSSHSQQAQLPWQGQALRGGAGEVVPKRRAHGAITSVSSTQGPETLQRWGCRDCKETSPEWAPASSCKLLPLLEQSLNGSSGNSEHKKLRPEFSPLCSCTEGSAQKSSKLGREARPPGLGLEMPHAITELAAPSLQ